MIEIKEKINCCGCGACADICPKKCISMVADEKGFLYPQVNKSQCVNCGLCEKICPVKNGKINDYEKTVYAAYNTDEIVRKISSSGGIFGLLAKKVLSNGGVVFGAAFADDFKSVRHIGIEKIEDLPKLYGSKYLQSETRETYKEAEHYLKSGREVLYVGTSCQIAGLKAYLKSEYEKLITADVICHGVPSPKVWRDYATLREDKIGSEIVGVAFRDKRCGWNNSVLLLLFADGTEDCGLSSKDYYIRGFLSNLYLRESCYDCKFKGEKVISDVSLGDFWGIDNVLPNFNDNKGVSAIILNSAKGQEFFDTVNGDLVIKSVEYSDVLKGNPVLVKPVAKPAKSDKFWEIYQRDGLNNALKKTCKISFIKRCFNFAKRVIKKVIKR